MQRVGIEQVVAMVAPGVVAGGARGQDVSGTPERLTAHLRAIPVLAGGK